MSWFKLKEPMGTNYRVDPADIMNTKQALNDLGYYKIPSHRGIDDWTDDACSKASVLSKKTTPLKSMASCGRRGRRRKPSTSNWPQLVEAPIKNHLKKHALSLRAGVCSEIVAARLAGNAHAPVAMTIVTLNMRMTVAPAAA